MAECVHVGDWLNSTWKGLFGPDYIFISKKDPWNNHRNWGCWFFLSFYFVKQKMNHPIMTRHSQEGKRVCRLIIFPVTSVYTLTPTDLTPHDWLGFMTSYVDRNIRHACLFSLRPNIDGCKYCLVPEVHQLRMHMRTILSALAHVWPLSHHIVCNRVLKPNSNISLCGQFVF